MIIQTPALFVALLVAVLQAGSHLKKDSSVERDMPTDASREGIVLDPPRHISGLGANLGLLTPEQWESVRELERSVELLPEAQDCQDYLSDGVFVNFLIARDWDHAKALRMIQSALQWRVRRPCQRWHLAGPRGDAERTGMFEQAGNTGKIRVPGVDRFGRAVMVFDNSRENVNDADVMIEFLAYNMDLCRRTALLDDRNADKIMLFMHLTGNHCLRSTSG